MGEFEDFNGYRPKVKDPETDEEKQMFYKGFWSGVLFTVSMFCLIFLLAQYFKQ